MNDANDVMKRFVSNVVNGGCKLKKERKKEKAFIWLPQNTPQNKKETITNRS